MDTYPALPVPEAFWKKDSIYADLPIDCRIILSYVVIEFARLDADQMLPIDDNRHPYIICPIAKVIEILGCKKDKAVGILKRLEEENLIRKIHQSFGMPDRIYLRPLRLGSNTTSKRLDGNRKADILDPDEAYATIISNINIELLLKKYTPDDIQSVFNIVDSVLHSTSPTVKISQNGFKANYVKQRLLSLRTEHVDFVLSRMLAEKNNAFSLFAIILARIWDALNALSLDNHLNALPMLNEPRGKTPAFEVGEAELEAIRAVLRGE